MIRKKAEETSLDPAGVATRTLAPARGQTEAALLAGGRGGNTLISFFPTCTNAAACILGMIQASPAPVPASQSLAENQL